MKALLPLTIILFLGSSIVAQNSVELKLNLEKNKTYRAKSFSQQNISQTIMDRQQSSEVKSNSTLSVRLVSNDANSITTTIRFDTISYTNTMPKMDVASYKPGNLASANPGEAMNTILNRLSKISLNVKLSNTGKVIEITNIKLINDSVLAGIDSIKGQSAMMVQLQAKMMVNEESLKGMIEMVMGYLPGKKVQAGDKWDSKIKVTAGGIAIFINSNYKLKKITGKQAEIKGETTNEPASSTPIEMGGAQITYDARGLGEVTLLVNTDSGWIIKASTRTHSQGNMGVKAQGQEFQIPTEIDSNSEIIGLQL